MNPSKLYILPIFVIILITCILKFSYSQNFQEFCDQNDKKVLLNIKNKLGNPGSLSSWDPNVDCAIWDGISCHNDQGRVTSLRINDAPDIFGPIPPFLDNLPYLTTLSFINVPNLSGPIPSYINKLTNLTNFRISGTQLTGPIPSLLSSFINLFEINLSMNKLTGPIPEFFGNFKMLHYMDLSFNQLTGPVPTALAKLTELTYLQLSSNKLTGPIPEFLARLKNTNNIELDSNQLTGPIPEYLGQMPNLTTLSLSNNQLTGPIPKSLGQSNLGFIRLAQNKLTGDAAFIFEKTSFAIDIKINNNLFKFDFSNVDLGRLVGFNISHNMIFGSLPKRFGQLSVNSVDVSYNQLCGPIPNGRRFKQVDPIVFSHNKCLCGGPLPACK